MKTTRKINQCSRTVRFLICVACLASMPAFSYAQEEKKPAVGAEDNKKINIEPTTITVTAQKESQPVLSSPVSITAVTSDDLVNSNIQALKSASAYAPNAFMTEFSARAVSNPFFRGIGGSPTNPGVSTIIDGVPQLNSYSSNIELIDVGQIEFVRGPEGALYGRNTAGGLINVRSSDLSKTWAAQGQADFGNYSRRDVRVSASSPLLKNRFGIALAGGYSSRDGYTVNDFTGRDVDNRAAGFGKVQLFYNANDRLSFRLILATEGDKDGDYALGDLGETRAHPHHVSHDFVGFNHRTVSSTTLVTDYHGGAIDFSSITGGVWWNDRALTDLDYQIATPANYGFFATGDAVENQHQFTQEFRFASSKDRPISMGNSLKLDWQTGVFIFNQDFKQNAVYSFSTAFGSSENAPSSDLSDSGMGLYGKARFTAWKKLSFTAGLRFDYESKSADLGYSGARLTNPSDNFSEVSPQFSLAYLYTPNQMVYASVTRGYKAGGFNPMPFPAGMESYGPEHTWNYELGHKAGWLKNRLETNVALFYIDWDNLQLNQQMPLSNGSYFIGNAGRANSKGLEVETRYRPFSWWELFGMVGYTRARFLSGSSALNANLGVNQPIGGNALPYTPSFNANMGSQVSWAPNGYVKLYFRVQLSKYGDFQYDASNAVGQESYHLVNFRGGVRTKHWFAEGWANNAFNAHYVPIAIPYAQLGAPSGYIGESGDPRTYGIRIGINY